MTIRLAALLVLLVTMFAWSPVRADGIALDSFTMTSSWPSGAQVEFRASSASEIVSVTANVTSGKGEASVVRRPTFTPGRQVTGSFAASPGRVSPFGYIRVSLTFEDSAGNRLRTDQQSVQYVDSRFKWQQAIEGTITTFWHDTAQGKPILRAAVDTVERYGTFTGVRVNHPITMVVYNSKEEMDSVVSYGSATSKSQLIILGQARSEDDLVLVMSGANGEVTASHELAHLITAEATSNPYHAVPFWLNEGLSVYVQGDNGPEYARLFESAKRNGRLLSLQAMTTPPGKPEEFLLMYGQGYQVVKYLVETYGPAKMSQYLAAHKNANDDDTPLRQTYGFDRIGLETEWRAAIGATDPPPPPVLSSATRRLDNQLLVPLVGGAAGVIGLSVVMLVGLLVVLRRRSI